MRLFTQKRWYQLNHSAELCSGKHHNGAVSSGRRRKSIFSTDYGAKTHFPSGCCRSGAGKNVRCCCHACEPNNERGCFIYSRSLSLEDFPNPVSASCRWALIWAAEIRSSRGDDERSTIFRADVVGCVIICNEKLYWNVFSLKFFLISFHSHWLSLIVRWSLRETLVLKTRIRFLKRNFLILSFLEAKTCHPNTSSLNGLSKPSSVSRSTCKCKFHVTSFNEKLRPQPH